MFPAPVPEQRHRDYPEPGREAGHGHAEVEGLGLVNESSEEFVHRRRHGPYPRAEKAGQSSDVTVGDLLHKTVIAGEERQGSGSDEEDGTQH